MKAYKPGTKVVAAVSTVGFPTGIVKGTPGKIVSYTPPIGARQALIYVQFAGASAPTCCWASDLAPAPK